MTAIAIAIGLPLLIVLAPASVIASAFLWKLHGDDRQADPRQPKPLLRLSLVMAVTGTLGALAGVALATASTFRLLGRLDIVETLTPLTLAALIGLDLIPIINAAYLRWLRGRRQRTVGRASPPPWSRED